MFIVSKIFKVPFVDCEATLDIDQPPKPAPTQSAQIDETREQQFLLALRRGAALASSWNHGTIRAVAPFPRGHISTFDICARVLGLWYPSAKHFNESKVVIAWRGARLRVETRDWKVAFTRKRECLRYG
jgi:hypothetical protein